MSAFEYGMIYIISWWVVLFMVLPFRAAPDDAAAPTAYVAAPRRTYLKQKLWATTVLALIPTALLAMVLHNERIMAWLAGS